MRLNDAAWLPFMRRALEAKQLNSLVFGSGQPLITGSQLKVLLIAKPSLNEQRAIATALSDVDALLEELDRLIAKKRDLKQAAMQQLLTGQTRLPGFRNEWQTKALREIVRIEKGELITESNVVPGPIPVIAGGKRPAYFHGYANRSGKTVTISGSGANAGYVSFHASPIFASDCSTISESKDYSIEFIYYLLRVSTGGNLSQSERRRTTTCSPQ